jgi:hypothetical protein
MGKAFKNIINEIQGGVDKLTPEGVKELNTKLVPDKLLPESQKPSNSGGGILSSAVPIDAVDTTTDVANSAEEKRKRKIQTILGGGLLNNINSPLG